MDTGDSANAATNDYSFYAIDVNPLILYGPPLVTQLPLIAVYG